MIFRALLFVLAAVLPLAVPARADTPIEYEARFAPKTPGVPALGAIAILDFTGAEGREFANALRAELQRAELEGRPVFNIRNRDDAAAPPADKAGAVRAGQQINANAVFFGAVTKAEIIKTDFKKDDRRCVGSSVPGFCSKYETVTLPCTRYSGSYSVNPSLYAIPDGREFYTEAVAVEREFSTCNGAVLNPSTIDKIITAFKTKKELPDEDISTPEALMVKLRTMAVATVREHITPYTKKIKVVFKDKSPELGSKDSEQFRSGVQFVKAGRLDRACGIFETLMTPDKASNVPLLYNLGACQEALEPDRPASALEYYSKADQKTTKPDALVSQSYLRMKAMVDAQREAARR